VWSSFSDLTLKQALQASLMSPASDSLTECPPFALFARLIASDEYSERELVRITNAWNLHDTDDACAWNIVHTNGADDTPLHVAREKGYWDVVRRLLHRPGVACRTVSSTLGSTPVLLACTAGQDAVATAMSDLSAGACKVDKYNTRNATVL